MPSSSLLSDDETRASFSSPPSADADSSPGGFSSCSDSASPGSKKPNEYWWESSKMILLFFLFKRCRTSGENMPFNKNCYIPCHSLTSSLKRSIWIFSEPKTHFNPLRTMDGYSRSLRDATGPVDMYSRIPIQVRNDVSTSRIPTSTQWRV